MLFFTMKTISIKQTSTLLDVSPATVHNWIKHGYLKPINNTKNNFRSKDVELLKRQITQGEINRLRNRANKSKANTLFISDEHIDNLAFVREIENIRKLFISEGLEISAIMLVLSIKYLVLTSELELDSIAKFQFAKWRRNTVKQEIYLWIDELNISPDNFGDNYQTLFDLLYNISNSDTLGIIYQSLIVGGDKSKTGVFYTPKFLIDEIFSNFARRDGKFLDHCCGTGQFIIGAAQNGYPAKSIYGYDIDDIAVRIARINLLTVFRDTEFSPNIHRLDSLTQITENDFHTENDFQLIATNPPWGAMIDNKAELKKLYPQITSGESFAYFLAKAIELSQKGGHISFILPESILNIRVHSDIRKYIVENTRIEAIHSIGRQFKSVFTPVIRLDLTNTQATKDSAIDIYIENNSHKIPQSRFFANENYIFDISLTEEENRIISLLYSHPHHALKNNAEWALGIVTGDNKKYILSTQKEGMEAIFTGKDILPFKLKKAKFYVKLNMGIFQQVAPLHKYRAKEKLIYKFVSDKLVFAYDDSGSLTLNSANILIPQIDGYPIKLILGLLNTKLYRWLFAKKFNALKVLRGDLEQLPLPIFNSETQEKILCLVEQAIAGENIGDSIDMLVMEVVGMTDEQMTMVMKKVI